MKKLSNSMKRRLAVEKAARRYSVTIYFSAMSWRGQTTTHSFATAEELRAFVKGVSAAIGWDDYEIKKIRPTLFEMGKTHA